MGFIMKVGALQAVSREAYFTVADGKKRRSLS